VRSDSGEQVGLVGTTVWSLRMVVPPGLDIEAMARYFERSGIAADGEWSATLVEGGRSNLTYFITDGARHWVLRRPPLGHVLASAHDVAREHRVISALAGSAVPVPRTVLLCTDESVLGAPFYVMERVAGHVYGARDEFAALAPGRRAAISNDLVDVLAALHTTDASSVGLGELGRPAGYLERQMRRWSQQLESSRSRDIPGIDDLFDRLAAAVPSMSRTGLVHGDYRIENVIVGGDDRVAAVLDWEMATLGDTWTDVGLFVLYWEGLRNAHPSWFAGAADAPGTPPVDELLGRYLQRVGIELVDLSWYVGFACFKLAVILEGIHFRVQMGKTVGAGFDGVSETVVPLVQRGLAATRGL
jgi:aminoglycoside phosphotransferase (APT) family kinase protein